MLSVINVVSCWQGAGSDEVVGCQSCLCCQLSLLSVVGWTLHSISIVAFFFRFLFLVSYSPFLIFSSSPLLPLALALFFRFLFLISYFLLFSFSHLRPFSPSPCRLTKITTLTTITTLPLAPSPSRPVSLSSVSYSPFLIFSSSHFRLFSFSPPPPLFSFFFTSFVSSNHTFGYPKARLATSNGRFDHSCLTRLVYKIR